MKSPEPLCDLTRRNQGARGGECCKVAKSVSPVPFSYQWDFFWGGGLFLVPGATSGYSVSLSLSLQPCRVLQSFPERDLLPICSEEQKLYTVVSK